MKANSTPSPSMHSETTKQIEVIKYCYQLETHVAPLSSLYEEDGGSFFFFVCYSFCKLYLVTQV